MRWYVEISPMGTKAGEELTLCVEAPQWQPALQKARALRGDSSALSNFSIELLDDGYRAIDPMARLRYIVKRAPDNAPLTNANGMAGSPSQPPKPVTVPPAAAKPAPEPPAAAKAPEPAKPAPEPAKPSPEPAKPATAPAASEPKNKEQAPSKAPEPASAAKSAPAPAAQAEPTQPKPRARDGLPSFVVIGNREDNPSEARHSRTASTCTPWRKGRRKTTRSACSPSASCTCTRRWIRRAPASSCASRSSITSSRAARSAARSSR